MGNGEEFFIRLILMLVFGGITAAIASSKGRNPVGWFFCGFFFSCLGLIIILCLSNLKEEQARWNAQNVEQRRLREQLRQEQLKNEALRQHAVARLDQHDQALGIDTRKTAPALTLTPQETPQSPLIGFPLSKGNEPPAPNGYPKQNWYINNNGQQDGPYSWELIYRRAKQGTLLPDTMVWAQGMGEWQPASNIPTLFA
jgi:hypothetical protein